MKFATLFLFALLLLLPVSASHASWMPSSRAAESTVWAVGDGGVGADSIPIANLISSRPFRYLFYLGDVYETGSADDFLNNYGFEEFAGRTAPTIGNHEWSNRYVGYYPYWAEKRGQAPPSYYRLWLSGWQILVLNSEAPHFPGSSQYRWLRRTLKKHPGQRACRLAISHRPR